MFVVLVVHIVKHVTRRYRLHLRSVSLRFLISHDFIICTHLTQKSTYFSYSIIKLYLLYVTISLTSEQQFKISIRIPRGAQTLKADKQTYYFGQFVLKNKCMIIKLSARFCEYNWLFLCFLSIEMKSPLILLTLLAFVYGGPFPGEEDEALLFKQEADTEPPPEVTVAELCSRLGLNTFVKLLNELNLTQLLETHPKGGRLTVIFGHMTK